MAIIKQCDMCKTLLNVDASVTITRKRKFKSQHDGEYTSSTPADYDLCEKCARQIELLFITVEKADETICV